MDNFSQPINRDRSIVIRCIKCTQPLAKIEIQQVFKIGMYLCEHCFLTLDGRKKETLTFMQKDYLFTMANGEIAIELDGINVQIPKNIIMRLLKND